MKLVIDTSALIAVIVGEPEKEGVLRESTGMTLLSPRSIPWEIGNAFSAMLRQKRLTLKDVKEGLATFQSIPIQYSETDFDHALELSEQLNMYACDAYVLECAIRQ